MGNEPSLLGLEPQPSANNTTARSTWEKANAVDTGKKIFMLSEPIQVRAIAFCDDNEKTEYD